MNPQHSHVRRASGALGASAAASLPRWRTWLRRPPKNTMLAISLVVVFHVVLYFQFTAPDYQMPRLLQRLVALADAAFVASVAQFSCDAWGARRRRLRLFGHRGMRVATLISAATFVLVAALWFSPWAPIKITADIDPPPPATDP